MNVHLYLDGMDQGLFPRDEVQRRYIANELPQDAYFRVEGEIEMRSITVLDRVLEVEKEQFNLPLQPSFQQPEGRLFRWPLVLGFCLTLVSVLLWISIGMVAGHSKTQLGTMDPVDPSHQIGADPRPIPNHPTAQTAKDVERRRYEFQERQWLKGYEERGNRNPKWDEKTVHFIKAWLLRSSEGPRDSHEGPDPQKMADELVGGEGWDDPLALTVAAHTSIEMHERAKRLEKAVESFDVSKHRCYPKLNATLWLATTLNDRPGRVQQLDSKALVFFKGAFADGSFTPEDQPIIADIFISGWGERFFFRNRSTLPQIVEGSGNSFRWLNMVLKGKRAIDDAWKARGDGLYNTVSPKGWQDFSDHLKEAEKFLTTAWKLRPDLPLAAALMEQVALGMSQPEEIRAWFEKALALQIDHEMAWNQMRWSLRPRWFGSKEEMIALGLSALESKRFDTNVPLQFGQAVDELEIEENLPPGEHIQGRRNIWPHLQIMYEGYIAEPKQAHIRAGWRTAYAVAAYFAGDWGVARAQLEQLHWTPHAPTIAERRADLSLFAEEVEARSGPFAQDIEKAESLRRRGAVVESLAIYSRLTKSGPSNQPRTNKFVRSRVASLEGEKRFLDNEWVDLLPIHPEDPNLQVLKGTISRMGPDGIEVHAGSDGHMILSRVRVGTDFEIRGEFELIHSSNGDTQAGVVFGQPNPTTWDWYAFRLKSNGAEGQVASYSQGWAKPQVYCPIKFEPKANRFQIRFQSNLLSAELNGHELFHEVKPPASIRVPGPAFVVGLGAFNDMNDTTIRYRTFQVRRLIGKGQTGINPKNH